MSTTLRQWSLRILERVGVRQLRFRSALGQPFLCHLGDYNSENPFYNRSHGVREIAIMAGWAAQKDHPVIVDVGANTGFISTQLALLLQNQSPEIYSFEPVPSTHAKLAASVRALDLSHCVSPVCCALAESARFLRVWYSDRYSHFAQASATLPSARVGAVSATCPALTLDIFMRTSARVPDLVKLDVEGFEAAVLEGAKDTLAGDDRPAICFELNPTTLSESGHEVRDITGLLTGYKFYYVDDFEGQRRGFGDSVASPADVDWTCNVFAVPRTEDGSRRWLVALKDARLLLERQGFHSH